MEIAFEIEFSFSFRVFSFFLSRARQMFVSARFTDLSDLFSIIRLFRYAPIPEVLRANACSHAMRNVR